MADEYITLREAASILGYADASNLRRAANSGRLKIRQLGPRATVTTRAWLEEYRQSLRSGGYKRGQTKAAGEKNAHA